MAGELTIDNLAEWFAKFFQPDSMIDGY